MSTSVATRIRDNHVNAKLSPAWQADFLDHLLPKVKNQVRVRFRDLPRVEREEAEAETVAIAVILFVRLVERGKNPSAFAVRIAKIAVLRVKEGRVVGTGERSRDVMSRLARQRRGFHVASLDRDETQTEAGWQEIIVEDRRSTPADVAACNIDFGAWLESMTSRRRQIAESLAAGYRTEEVAEQFHLSPGRISQLRREFEESWREFQQEVNGEQAAACATA